MVEKFSDLFEFPLPDEVKKAIEEILGEQEVKEELMRIGILELMQRKGGEIRLAKESGENPEPQVRKYEEDDLSALVEIVNENYMDYADLEFFYEFIPYTEEMLRPKVEGRPVVFVAKNQTVEGFITCYMAFWGITIDTLCVKRGPNREKIEDMLISKVEEGAKGWKVVVFLSSDSPRIADFEKKGYEIYGGLYHMTANLGHVYPVPPVPEGVTLRGMRTEDANAITRAFYNPEKVGSSIFRPGFTGVWREDWNHVAELDGKIISVFCARPEQKYNEYYHAKRAEIWGPITLSEHSGKGLEKALMSRALNSLREKGMEVAAVVDTETSGYIKLYGNLGFKVKKHWKFLRKYHKDYKLHEIR